MFRKVLLVMLLLLIGILAQPSAAATIHVHYFESADFLLTQDRFQLYSFSAIEGEQVTLVVYGLDEGLIPSLSILDINGLTVVEDNNPNQLEVAVVELTASDNGLYTALVSRQSEAGGLVRVMLFEGDPLAADTSLLDTIDPLLPSRAYFAKGDTVEPISMTVSVLDDEDDETPLPQIFASRGSEVTPPPLEERVTAIDRFTWQNNNGDVFYTLNVRSIPEDTLPTSRKVGGFLSYTAQFLDISSIRLDIGQGNEDPEYLPRPQCVGQAQAGATFLAGPGKQFIDNATLAQKTTLEIIGSNKDFWLVVDPNSPTGGSFILKSSVEVVSVPEDCTRANLEVLGPDETANNTKPRSNNSGRGSNPFGSLTPYTGSPNDAPDTKGDVVRLPPQPPNSGDPSVANASGFTIILECIPGNLSIKWMNIPTGFTGMGWNVNDLTAPAPPFAGGTVFPPYSGFAFVGSPTSTHMYDGTASLSPGPVVVPLAPIVCP